MESWGSNLGCSDSDPGRVLDCKQPSIRDISTIALIDELIRQQQEKLLEVGRQFMPQLTVEDLLQPMDYAALEYNPHFRYEEGILAGLQSVRAALLAG